MNFKHLRVSGVRVGVDLKIFDLLAASETPLSLEHLTQATGAASLILSSVNPLTRSSRQLILTLETGRLLRYLASVGMIKETGKDTYAATNITKTLALPGNQAGIRH